ncbi:MAG: transposase [Chloroflexota bacterium]|nr:MAG: transposase [Chloroflexota bacterium]
MPAKPVQNAPIAAGAVTSISGDDFWRICRELDLASRLEQILLLTDGGILSCGRIVDPIMADDLAKKIWSTWDVETHTAQIQYVRLNGNDEPLLLFTKPVSASLLTLAARIETSISVLSRNADLLSARLLREAGRALKNGQAARVVDAYAIAWRPVEPMSRALRQAVKMSLSNLAQESGCRLTFVGVASDHVHLVMHCPPHKTSSWAAHTFKGCIQEDIQRLTGDTIDLWRKGFLASPSTEPLPGEELLAYLSDAL